VDFANKNSEVRSDHRPCDNTPTAATVAETTGGVSLWPCTARGIMKTNKTPFSTCLRATVASLGVSSHGLKFKARK
jgi:hypothetical protein